MKIKEQLLAVKPKWFYTIVVCVVILYLTLVPKPLPDNDLSLIPHFDKIAHAIMFGGLSGVAVFDIMRKSRRLLAPSRRRLLLIFVLVSSLGGVIELLQYAMELGRSADWIDFLADTIGAAVGVLAAPAIVGKIFR